MLLCLHFFFLSSGNLQKLLYPGQGVFLRVPVYMVFIKIHTLQLSLVKCFVNYQAIILYIIVHVSHCFDLCLIKWPLDLHRKKRTQSINFTRIVSFLQLPCYRRLARDEKAWCVKVWDIVEKCSSSSGWKTRAE